MAQSSAEPPPAHRSPTPSPPSTVGGASVNLDKHPVHRPHGRLTVHIVRKNHASFTLFRHLGPSRPPDDARRHRQQHRQRQHRGLQVLAGAVPGHAVPGAHQRRCRPAGHRRYEPRAGGPGRQGGRRHHQLPAGRLAAHQPSDRHDDLGRRLLRGGEGRRAVVLPRGCVLVRCARPAGHPGRRTRPGMGGRRRRQYRPELAPHRPPPSRVHPDGCRGHDRRNLRGQPPVRRSQLAPSSTVRSTCSTVRARPTR